MTVESKLPRALTEYSLDKKSKSASATHLTYIGLVVETKSYVASALSRARL
eukprot:CAMPEP_0115302006 /NCGR_PEP_ID=MMETSP0270-20121206/70157_1 /TAXON_ID=71861 /ORGANISM="Scrippsiella trochoidea, Strain CCMP3099" /LENGTH=50 /DNA_ID=CAMNT_0002719913 /DNA_START=32 /DNA_END=184 /DNA_ORIENTATION=-